MKKNLLKNKKGQTSVEYILMVAVVATLAFSIMRIVKERIMADAGNCTESSVSLICLFQNLYDRREFTYFTILRTF